MSDNATPGLAEIKAKVKGTNINEKTLLATDYLNHFNEVVMMIDMLPDMPDCLDMVQDWEPKSYQDHFRDSTIADKGLAVEAYEFVEPTYRAAFEQYISEVDHVILLTIEEAAKLLEQGDMEFFRFKIGESAQQIHALQDKLNAIIHGTASFLEEDGQEETGVFDQDDIDALFD